MKLFPVMAPMGCQFHLWLILAARLTYWFWLKVEFGRFQFTGFLWGCLVPFLLQEVDVNLYIFSQQEPLTKGLCSIGFQRDQDFHHNYNAGYGYSRTETPILLYCTFTLKTGAA